jgi:tetratricopeptide (TPR) repeat protein
MKKKNFTIFLRAVFLVFTLGIYCIAFEVYAQSSDRLIKEGISMMEKGDYASARDRFQTAVRMNDSDYVAHYLLGRSLFHLREYDSSEKELLRTIQLQPTRHPLAYVYLGDIAYLRNDTQTAKEYWEKAHKIDPSLPGLDQRLAKADHDTKVDKKFIQYDSLHFAVKYEGAERYEAGAIVLDILEDAYRDIGRDLGHYPLDKVQTILYSKEQFREIPGIPGWSGAVYDGKIRLGIGGVTSPTPALRSVLYHEYTHAVVRDITPRCPAWLHEGLAQYFEGRRITPEIRFVPPHRNSILPNLEGSFRDFSAQQARVDYLTSLSAVQYMIDRYGMMRVRNLLQDLAKYPDTATAIDSALYVSYEQFERDWRKSIE